jgi:hypothetical protein
MPKRLAPSLSLAAAWCLCAAFGYAQTPAAVCEIVNESKVGVRFSVIRQGVQPREYALVPQVGTQISTTGSAELELAGGRVPLVAGMKYAFRENAQGQVSLKTVGRRAAEAKPKPKPNPPIPAPPAIKPVVPTPVVPTPIVPTPGKIAPGITSPAIPTTPLPPGKLDVPTGKPTLPHVTVPPLAVPPVAATGEPVAPRVAARVATVAVKICVDDEEAARDEIWKKRIGDRLAAASAITEKTAGVRFQAVEFARWDSDDAIHDFSRTLSEFEKEVASDRARLIVGFSSQYEIPRGEVHLGGTRGPLHSHILIREWSRHIAEPERLEVLVHEIGHFLGAVHSSDTSSVMRAKLGDRRSRAVNFEIRYDDANSQILRIFGDEMRLRPVRRLADLSDRTKADLLARYDALAKANPKDPAVKRHIELVEQVGGRR